MERNTSQGRSACLVEDRVRSGIIGYGIGYPIGATMREPRLFLGPDLVKLIAEIDEFKGRWEALRTLSPDRLGALRKVATIESIGSSTRIEGAKLSDADVEDLLSRAISHIVQDAG